MHEVHRDLLQEDGWMDGLGYKILVCRVLAV